MLLKLKNFLIYPEAVVDLPAGKVALFVGPNGSGKSTLLDAFEWALFGVARGYTKQNESGALKRDPANPMSVSVETKKEWAGFPRGIQRASKLTVLPIEAADNFKGNVDRYRSILGVWSLINSNASDRCALMNAICKAGASDADILAEIKKIAPAPPVGEYNGVKWQDFGDVPGALEKAMAIRKGYHAAKTGAVPEEIRARLAKAKADLAALPTIERPAPLTVSLTREEADGQSFKIVRDQGKTKFLDQNLIELQQRLSAHKQAVEITEAFRVEVCAAAEKRLNDELEDLNARWDVASKLIDEHTTLQNEFDENFKKRDKLTKAITRDEQDILSIEENAGNAKSRWDSWNKVVECLQPGGAVAAAVLERAATGIDRARLEWAGKTLGVSIELGADGTVTIGSRAPNVSSKAQNLLAGLALQDALCIAGEVPFLLADELDVLHGENLTRGLTFLAKIAPDYEGILAAYTGKRIEGLTPEFAQFACEGGRLRQI